MRCALRKWEPPRTEYKRTEYTQVKAITRQGHYEFMCISVRSVCTSKWAIIIVNILHTACTYKMDGHKSSVQYIPSVSLLNVNGTTPMHPFKPKHLHNVINWGPRLHLLMYLSDWGFQACSKQLPLWFSWEAYSHTQLLSEIQQQSVGPTQTLTVDTRSERHKPTNS